MGRMAHARQDDAPYVGNVGYRANSTNRTARPFYGCRDGVKVTRTRIDDTYHDSTPFELGMDASTMPVADRNALPRALKMLSMV
jgi:hypothetical protein